MSVNDVQITFTDVELQCLSKLLGEFSVAELAAHEFDSVYLMRALRKVLKADEE